MASSRPGCKLGAPSRRRRRDRSRDAPRRSGFRGRLSGRLASRPGKGRGMLSRVQAEPFDEAEFFGALERSGARVLLIGRRALVALGIPVGTFDYDLWAHVDDIPLLNGVAAEFDLVPNKTPEQARATGM